jgi:basic membrane protein A and related proteins
MTSVGVAAHNEFFLTPRNKAGAPMNLSPTPLRVMALAATASILMSACGKKEEPKPAAPAPAPAAAPAAAAPAAPLKIAFAYVGPVGTEGWTFAHDQGRKAVEAEFGNKVTTVFAESVPESADAERVIRQFATDGAKMIFGTTFGYMDPMLKVAGDFKDVRFEHATGFKTADNMRTYDSRTYEGAYMAGVVAGKMTKSGTLGVVGSIPIPEVIRNINSFTMGAQTQNPNVKTKVVWIGKWFDPPKEGEAAQSLINQGADILFQNTDSGAVLQTAEKNQKLAFGWDSDMSHLAKEAHLGSAIIDWAPYYKSAVKAALDGTWKTHQVWWGVKEGAIDLIKISDKVPAETKAQVDKIKAGLKDGSFHPWKGPVVDQDGKTVVEKDQTPDDKFMLGINFYVKGVEGKVPTGK